MLKTAVIYVVPVTGTLPASINVTLEWTGLGMKPFQEPEDLETPQVVLKDQPGQEGPMASILKPP